MRSRVGSARSRVGSIRSAVGSGGTIAPPAAATTFSVSLSAPSGTVNVTQTATVTPGAGGWPANQAISLQAVGVACAVSPDTRTGTGTTPVTFSFTPSVAGTLTVNAVATGMTSTGPQSYVVSAVQSPVVIPPATTNGNRFDIVLAASSVAPGQAVSGGLYPNGNWQGGTVTLTPSNGDPAFGVVVPNSGNAATAFSYTPSVAGEVILTPSNTANLFNPWPAPLTVFTAASGSASTISATSVLGDRGPFQRDTASGNPTGFSTSWARGWGEVLLSLVGSGTALFARLYDSMSSGATTAQGTGTALTGIVQVYGAWSTGTKRIMLPAGPYEYFVELASDAAFTNPFRVPQRVRVGVVIAMGTRSQECGLARGYDDSTASPNTYHKTVVQDAYDPRYSIGGDSQRQWFLVDGNPDPDSNHYGEAPSSGAMRAGQLVEQTLGVLTAITGDAGNFGGFDQFVAHGGALRSNVVDTVALTCRNKFRYYFANSGDWDNVDSAYPYSYAEWQSRMLGVSTWIPANYPACAVIRWCCGTSGWFGSSSAPLGTSTNDNNSCVQQSVGTLRAIEASNPMFIAGEDTLWNEFQGGHATQGARQTYVESYVRMLLAAEVAVMGGQQTSNRGPLLGASASYNAGTRTISVPYTLHGGSTLTTVGCQFNNPSRTFGSASAAEIACMWSIYSGTNTGYGSGPAIMITSATINSSAHTIDLVLAGSSGVVFSDGTTAATVPSSMTVHYAADYCASNKTISNAYTGDTNRRGVSLCDDNDPYGYGYGFTMRPAVNIAVAA